MFGPDQPAQILFEPRVELIRDGKSRAPVDGAAELALDLGVDGERPVGALLDDDGVARKKLALCGRRLGGGNQRFKPRMVKKLIGGPFV